MSRIKIKTDVGEGLILAIITLLLEIGISEIKMMFLFAAI